MLNNGQCLGWVLPGHRWAAISHDCIQPSLRLFRVIKIPCFEHFAFIPDHLIDIDRIVPAVLWTVVIDAADVLVLVR